MQTRYKMQTENLYCLFVWYVIICHLTTYRVSRNRFSATIFYDYLHYVEYFQPVSWSQTFLFQAWCLYRIHQLDKRGCSCKWGLTIEYLTRAIFEKQLTALHVVHKFHLFNRYVFSCQKCGPGPKLFPRLDIFSTFRGVHILIFTYVPYIVIGLHEEPANFCREKWRYFRD